MLNKHNRNTLDPWPPNMTVHSWTIQSRKVSFSYSNKTRQVQEYFDKNDFVPFLYRNGVQISIILFYILICAVYVNFISYKVVTVSKLSSYNYCSHIFIYYLKYLFICLLAGSAHNLNTLQQTTVISLTYVLLGRISSHCIPQGVQIYLFLPRCSLIPYHVSFLLIICNLYI